MFPAFANWSAVMQENILVFKSQKKKKKSQLSDSCIRQTRLLLQLALRGGKGRKQQGPDKGLWLDISS